MTALNIGRNYLV